MAYPYLLCENRDALRVLTIDRADKLNALSPALLDSLHAAFADAGSDPSVRVVVLAGAGPKAFVAGADIAAMAELSPLAARDFSRHGQALMQRIERLGKPVIARIQGYALGGGLELAMACHLRVATESAKFGQPEVSLGLIPGFGGTQRLLRLVGRGAALELCLLGQAIGAARALELGLVHRVVAETELDPTIAALADALAHAAPQALRGILDAILLGGEASIEHGLEHETLNFALAFSTADWKEGSSAFLDKRKPVFSGH